MKFEGASVSFAHHKSFGKVQQGFQRISAVNVVIGRNNTGKSALLDLVEFLCPKSPPVQPSQPADEPIVQITLLATAPAIERAFPKGTSGGLIPGNYFEFGAQWIGRPITMMIHQNGEKIFGSADPPFPPEIPSEMTGTLAREISNPFQSLSFKRIVADRDIKPEVAGGLVVFGDGTGITNLIQHVLNEATSDESLVTQEMLKALNEIFDPDARFTRIQTKHLADNRWEIYLEEESKGSIALSASGSGLKTVIIVLAHLLLLPGTEGRSLSSYVFGFEELENNLHPGLQRRLFAYMRNLAVEMNTTFFLTTHSNVVIDLFSGDLEAQILHVTHDGVSATVNALSDHLGHSRVLDDLDVRASDLLQSNGVVWVEGPSDRVYVNRYLQLLFGDRFREGAHYQCVFYGGRLLRA